jgi:hypothetical protein
MPGARCTRSLACKNKKSTRGRHHRFTGATRHSPRNGFNGLLRDLPGDRLDCHRRLADMALSAPGRADLASAKLDAGIEASGPHDFTVRNSIVRLRARASLTGWTPPCDHDCAPTLPRPPHPCPTSVTIAKRPSFGPGRARHANDLRRAGRELFLHSGLDRKITDLPVGQTRPNGSGAPTERLRPHQSRC